MLTILTQQLHSVQGHQGVAMVIAKTFHSPSSDPRVLGQLTHRLTTTFFQGFCTSTLMTPTILKNSGILTSLQEEESTTQVVENGVVVKSLKMVLMKNLLRTADTLSETYQTQHKNHSMINNMPIASPILTTYPKHWAYPGRK